MTFEPLVGVYSNSGNGSSTQITILLATYNGDAFLEPLLGSLQEQNFTHWRLLARDDGSTDATINILRSWASRHPDRITILEDGGEQLGVKDNFARLMAAVNSPWFMCCDQDDVWMPDKLAAFAERMSIVEKALGRETPILIHSDLIVVDRHLVPLDSSFWRLQGFDVRRGARLRALLARNIVTGCASMGNSALRRAVLPIPAEAQMHDWWLALVAASVGRIEALERATVLYRQHGANLIGSQTVGWATQIGIWLKRPHPDSMHRRLLAAVPRWLHPRKLQAKALVQLLGACMVPERRAECMGFLRPRTLSDIAARLRDVWECLKLK